jgi:hypothetical protein
MTIHTTTAAANQPFKKADIDIVALPGMKSPPILCTPGSRPQQH